ncbi:transketolase [Eubacteriales bacterium]|nr:transketolase [Oscillospiraceae bacterium]MCM0707333.1 transketolase [Faecalicatena sp. BF-R-105]GKH51179.1 transketolase [Eubacteriales bacterium]GKH63897.1 transketolase [Eubacteriales bacterium]SFI93306.1 transketolase [Ruminococcaceae bacterium D5]
MKNISVQELRKHAKELRKTALTMIYEAQSGHPGGAFSTAEITAALYYGEMNIDPKNPKWPDRDRYILSKGHACPIQYAALGLLGYFPEEKLHTLRQEGSILQGHPDMKKCPGIDISTGSLGQGLSCGVGMALAGKRDGKDYRVFVIVGDGELDEGQIWEAVMAGNAWNLDNLVIILDNNGLQLDGTTDQVIPHLDLTKKFEAFGYETYEIDGNDMEQVVETLKKIDDSTTGRPKCINAHTVKGKGVSFMENQLGWHGMAPNAEQYAIAMEELERGF